MVVFESVAFRLSVGIGNGPIQCCYAVNYSKNTTLRQMDEFLGIHTTGRKASIRIDSVPMV